MEKETEKKNNIKNVTIVVLKIVACTAAAAAGAILGNYVYDKMK